MATTLTPRCHSRNSVWYRRSHTPRHIRHRRPMGAQMPLPHPHRLRLPRMRLTASNSRRTPRTPPPSVAPQPGPVDSPTHRPPLRPHPRAATHREQNHSAVSDPRRRDTPACEAPHWANPILPGRLHRHPHRNPKLDHPPQPPLIPRPLSPRHSRLRESFSLLI